MVISQRLVKTLCPECRHPVRLTEESMINHVGGYMKDILEEAVTDIDFYRSSGCSACGNMGYKGRMGVHEVLMVDNTIEPLILNRASSHEIEQQAKKQGMITIIQDALLKAATGKVSIDEALKIV